VPPEQASKISEKPMEKYKELYDLSIKLMSEEVNRVNQIDNKANGNLRVLIIVFSLIGFSTEWSVVESAIPPDSFMDWAITTLLLGLIVLMPLSLYKTYAVNKPADYKRMPLTEELIRFFRVNRTVDIYYTLSKANQLAYEDNLELTERKIALLKRSYLLVIPIFVIVLILFIFEILAA